MSNKSGVTGDVISLPQGGGALQGIGETFAADPFTGTGSLSVPLACPPGRNGLQPDLTLDYSSGGGNGPFGLGWRLSVPDITRQTSRGIPRYRDDATHPDASDGFILSGAEDLVAVTDDNGGGAEFRPRTEGLFARIRRFRDAEGDFWQVESRDGLVSLYGTPGAGGSDPAVVADPADRSRVYRWRLSQTTDPFGNRVRYHYLRDAGGDGARSWDQLYLRRIEYVDFDRDGEQRFLVSVRFVYDERPDPFSSYRAGFEVRTRLRCRRVEVRSHAGHERLVRTYELEYLDERIRAGELSESLLPANGVSLLSRLRVVGHDGDDTQALPPLEFGYTPFRPTDRASERVRAVDDAVPPRSLAADDFELIDLFGNGLPDIVQMNGATLFWRNLGAGVFDRPRAMPEVPSGVQLGDPGVRFADLNGNGRADLLVTDRGGYFPLSFAGRWSREGFVTYEQVPTFGLESADVRLLDIDGDGVVDALHTGDQFTVFFNDPQAGWNRVDTVPRRPMEEFPDVRFSAPQVKLADMSGDGLQDIVFVDRGRVDYWPNLGHGRWGRRITMRASPDIDDPLAPPGLGFDPARLLFGDVDGDGAADVVYVESRRVTAWINRNGDGFAPPFTIDNTPLLSAPDAVRLVDLEGVGTSGLLWTSDQSGPDADHYRFLYVAGAAKPYLLTETNNHMGAVTRVAYAPSTLAYLDDETDPSTRWQTPLPFPVQVVQRVESIDELSGGKLTTEYRYHHGYWDGAEREFRGFGRVDQLDSESFEQFNQRGLDHRQDFRRVDDVQFSPPTLTKTWFHLGPVGDEFMERTEADFSSEYWPGDPPKLRRTRQVTELLGALADEDRAHALRALRGSVLRTEVYAVDGGPRSDRPYTVSETSHGLREESPPHDRPSRRRRVFFPHVLARRTTRWERGDDPMTLFVFTGDYDGFGQPRSQTRIGCPRGWRELDDRPGAPYLATRTRTHFAAPVDPTTYIVDRAARVTTYEIRNDGTERIFDLRDAPDDAPAMSVVEQTLNYFDGDAFAGRALGELGEHGALTRTEGLVLTERILRDAYRSTDAPGDVPPYLVPGSPPVASGEYPQEFLDLLPSLAGYDFRPGEAGGERGYFATTTRHRYDFHDRGGIPRGLVTASRDALGRETTIRYGFFDLLATEVTDPAGLPTRAHYDERVLQPRETTDPNGNRTLYAYTPLGLLQSIAVMGKEGEAVGDDEPTPGTRLEYHLSAFAESPPAARQPVSVRTLQRVHHVHATDVPPPERDATLERVEYSDGFGRLLQTRVQGEDALFGDIFGGGVVPADHSAPAGDAVARLRAPGAAPHVVVSGATTYDNKGRVVEQFEPYFDAGFAYAAPTQDQRGRKATVFYEPGGRPVRTIAPDGSDRRVVMGVPGSITTPDLSEPDVFEPTPWETYTYDANDLAPLRPPPGERDAAPTDRVPRDHHFTPASIEVDALGRITRATQRNGPDPRTQWFTTRSTYDVRGRVLTVTDALGRRAFRYTHDLVGNPLRVESIDAGLRRRVLDAGGSEIERRDSKGAVTLQAHDPLQRPVRTWARDDATGVVTLRERLVYGDGGDRAQPPAERAVNRAANRLGVLHEHYDEAGRLTLERYDFKGNVVDKVRQVIRDEAIASVADSPVPDVRPFRVDWQPPGGTTLEAHAATLLDAFEYRSTTTYDALNRVVLLRYPVDVEGKRRGLQTTYNGGGALEQRRLDGDVVVEHAAYDAKRQRTLVALGNGVMTRYAYDPGRTRLARLRSERYRRAAPEGPAYAPVGAPLQDYAYDHDPVGNIVAIQDRTPESGVDGTPRGRDALDRAFIYDPLYRLVAATGRECDRAPPPAPWGDRERCTDPGRTRPYSQRYGYDAVGNLLRLDHVAGGASFTRGFDLVPGTNRLASMTTGDGDAQPVRYRHDANGNIVNETAARHFAWDHNDRLTAFRDQPDDAGSGHHVRCLYDARGQRVKKLLVSGTGEVETTVCIDGTFECHRWRRDDGVAGANNEIHVTDDHDRVAVVRVGKAHPEDPGPATRFHLADHLGSGNVVIDGGGTLLRRDEYLPFGETSFGSFARTRPGFTGMERDRGSGLSYHGTRYYAPWIGRWTSPDPSGPVDAPNLYTYVGDNPLRYTDRGGRQRQDTAVPDVHATQPSPDDDDLFLDEGVYHLPGEVIEIREAEETVAENLGRAGSTLRAFAAAGKDFSKLSTRLNTWSNTLYRLSGNWDYIAYKHKLTPPAGTAARVERGIASAGAKGAERASAVAARSSVRVGAFVETRPTRVWEGVARGSKYLGGAGHVANFGAGVLRVYSAEPEDKLAVAVEEGAGFGGGWLGTAGGAKLGGTIGASLGPAGAIAGGLIGAGIGGIGLSLGGSRIGRLVASPFPTHSLFPVEILGPVPQIMNPESELAAP